MYLSGGLGSAGNMESGIHRKRASGARQETVVRPARLNDDTRLSAFIIRAWKEAGPGALGFTGATDEAVGEIASVGFLSKLLKSPNVRVFVAEESSV